MRTITVANTLGELRAARAAARQRVWLQAADTRRLLLSTTANEAHPRTRRARI